MTDADQIAELTKRAAQRRTIANSVVPGARDRFAAMAAAESIEVQGVLTASPEEPFDAIAFEVEETTEF